MGIIQQNLSEVLEKIKLASNDRDDVKLLAVSKTKPVSMILEAFNANQRIFGENKVQEAREKSPQLPEEINWHLIGPLQKNKVKHCPQIFSTIHTVNKIEIAELISVKSFEADVIMEVLVQMNLSGEETKSGVSNYEELKKLNDKIIGLKNVRLVGLMTMGDPNVSDSQNRKYFSELREILLKEAVRLGLKDQFTELSMGMSSDYELALKEGATYIRVGSAIFGNRK